MNRHLRGLYGDAGQRCDAVEMADQPQQGDRAGSERGAFSPAADAGGWRVHEQQRRSEKHKAERGVQPHAARERRVGSYACVGEENSVEAEIAAGDVFEQRREANQGAQQGGCSGDRMRPLGNIAAAAEPQSDAREDEGDCRVRLHRRAARDDVGEWDDVEGPPDQHGCADDTCRDGGDLRDSVRGFESPQGIVLSDVGHSLQRVYGCSVKFGAEDGLRCRENHGQTERDYDV